MARPRSITVEYLNSIVENDDYEVIGRENDPNYCTIRFKDCGHIRPKMISTLKDSHKRGTACSICFENNLRYLLNNKGFHLLSKVKYGEAKSSGEYRLCTCNKCGNFIFVLPSSIYKNGSLQCSICEYNYYKELAYNKGYKLINRIDKYYLEMLCKCGFKFKYQSSNLRRVNPRCVNCGKKDIGSFVYAFIIENSIGSFIKIGKSNSPYLRHLNFSEKNENSYTFISSKRFDKEIDAYKYEKVLFNKFSSFRLSPEFSRLFMDNGYTEVFSIDILDSVRKELKN